MRSCLERLHCWTLGRIDQTKQPTLSITNACHPPNEEMVPLDVFIQTTKTLLLRLFDLGVEMQVNRVTLMRSDPSLTAERLAELSEGIRRDHRFVAVRESISNIRAIEDISKIQMP